MIRTIQIGAALAAVTGLVVGCAEIETSEPRVWVVALCCVLCITAGFVISAMCFASEDEKEKPPVYTRRQMGKRTERRHST